MVIGVYLIINCITQKIYAGSSTDIEGRFYEHRYFLNKGNHKNPKLQASWNKYGEDAFHFCIVEECSIENILKIEQLWINSIVDNCYNISLVAGNTLGNFHSDKTKLKISNARKGQKLNFTSEYRLELAKRGTLSLQKANALRLAWTPEAVEKRRLKSLGNQKRRNKNKWPHDLGVKCLCCDCVNRKRHYQKLRQEKIKNNQWNFRKGTQVKNELEF